MMFAMDKRQQKTRLALYKAFEQVLKEKDYEEISIEDILEKSKVSRSTFYAHFKSKDDLRDSILRNIFSHVFSHSLEQESTHDFSKSSVLDYEHIFTHILYHLRDDKGLIRVLLGGSCRYAIMDEMRVGVRPLIERCLKDGTMKKKGVPDELALSLATEDFVVAISYWFDRGCLESPEIMTHYLLMASSQ